MSLKQDWENTKKFDWVAAVESNAPKIVDEKGASCFWCGKKSDDGIEEIVIVIGVKTGPRGTLIVEDFCNERCYDEFDKARSDMDAAEAYEERTHGDVLEHKHVSYPHWHPAARIHTTEMGIQK